MFWLALASWSYVLAGPGFLETMLWQALFWQVRVALVHLEALSSDQLMKREGWLCWSSVRLAVGYASGRPWLLGAMSWLGRASLKPCSGKLCFGSFRVALVHLEALSSDQLMKREGWLCWSSVRLAAGYVLAGPGFLELCPGLARLA